MLLTCNIENQSIELGLFDRDQLVYDARISASFDRSTDEYAVLLQSLFKMDQVDAQTIDGAIVSSVVRPLTAIVCAAIEKLTGITPLVVGPGLKTGLNIKTDIPSQVGADIVANAVAAVALTGGPMVFIDFGTATTLTGLDTAGDLCGVLICPGIRSSLDALSAHAAELPSIALDQPKCILGKNTLDSMVGGLIHGHAAMIDGLLDRIAADWGLERLTAIATGDLAEKILSYCQNRHHLTYEPHLTLQGLRRIYRLNVRPKKSPAALASH